MLHCYCAYSERNKCKKTRISSQTVDIGWNQQALTSNLYVYKASFYHLPTSYMSTYANKRLLDSLYINWDLDNGHHFQELFSFLQASYMHRYIWQLGNTCRQQFSKPSQMNPGGTQSSCKTSHFDPEPDAFRCAVENAKLASGRFFWRCFQTRPRSNVCFSAFSTIWKLDRRANNGHVLSIWVRVRA
jgi:hypothetical protein